MKEKHDTEYSLHQLTDRSMSYIISQSCFLDLSQRAAKPYASMKKMRRLVLGLVMPLADPCQGTHLRSEHSCIGLHGPLQLAADLRHAQAALGVAELVQALYRVGASVCRQVWLVCTRLAILGCSTQARQCGNLCKVLCTSFTKASDKHEGSDDELGLHGSQAASW